MRVPPVGQRLSAGHRRGTAAAGRRRLRTRAAQPWPSAEPAHGWLRRLRSRPSIGRCRVFIEGQVLFSRPSMTFGSERGVVQLPWVSGALGLGGRVSVRLRDGFARWRQQRRRMTEGAAFHTAWPRGLSSAWVWSSRCAGWACPGARSARREPRRRLRRVAAARRSLHRGAARSGPGSFSASRAGSPRRPGAVRKSGSEALSDAPTEGPSGETRRAGVAGDGRRWRRCNAGSRRSTPTSGRSSSAMTSRVHRRCRRWRRRSKAFRSTRPTRGCGWPAPRSEKGLPWFGGGAMSDNLSPLSPDVLAALALRGAAARARRCPALGHRRANRCVDRHDGGAASGLVRRRRGSLRRGLHRRFRSRSSRRPCSRWGLGWAAPVERPSTPGSRLLSRRAHRQSRPRWRRPHRSMFGKYLSHRRSMPALKESGSREAGGRRSACPTPELERLLVERAAVARSAVANAQEAPLAACDEHQRRFAEWRARSLKSARQSIRALVARGDLALAARAPRFSTGGSHRVCRAR